MIWTFCTDLSSYFVICRGLCVRTFHDREDHALPTWQLFLRDHNDTAQKRDLGRHYVGRPGKPPHLDTLWPRFASDISVWSTVDCYRPWDDTPWEIHKIQDDVAREAAHRAYVAEHGPTSPENLKRRLMYAFRLVMKLPVLVQEIL